MNEFVLAIVSGSVGAAIVSGVFSVLLWKLNNKNKEDQRGKDIVNGIRMLMYYRIKNSCQEYIRVGEIPADALEDLIEMHKVYHNNLDGNGFLDSLMKQIKSLPIKY